MVPCEIVTDFVGVLLVGVVQPLKRLSVDGGVGSARGKSGVSMVYSVGLVVSVPPFRL